MCTDEIWSVRMWSNTVYDMYSPSQGRTDEENTVYMNSWKTREELDNLRHTEEVIIMGDHNEHVGQRTEVMGHHGIGQRVIKCDRILKFCNSNSMKIMEKPHKTNKKE